MLIDNAELSLWMEQVNKRLEKLEAKPIFPPTETAKTEQVAVGDFVRSKNPKTSLEMALIISYHLEKISGISPFTMDDIRQGFIQSKEPIPGNPSDIVYQAIKRGYMMKTATKKKDNFFPLVLTNLGEKYVEQLHMTSQA